MVTFSKARGGRSLGKISLTKLATKPVESRRVSPKNKKLFKIDLILINCHIHFAINCIILFQI